MWEKKLYIAKRIRVEEDDYGNQISYFDKPKKYWFNYQPLDGDLDYQQYGDRISNYFRAFIDMCYLGEIKTGDKAYLIDGEIQDVDSLVLKDDENCTLANYTIKVVLPQNLKIKIDFEKVAKQ